MTDITARSAAASQVAHASTSTKATRSGSWLTTTDHKRIAILYALSITFFFFIGGHRDRHRAARVAQRRRPISLTDEQYNRLFTLHGIVMVWFFLVPSIPTTFGNFLLPMMIGAKRRRLPAPQPDVLVHLRDRRGVHASTRSIAGGVDTGWTFYTPLSTFLPTATSSRRPPACSSSAFPRLPPASISSPPPTCCARRA